MKTPPTWEEELKNKVFRFVPVTPGDKILIQTFVQSLLTSHEATIRQEIAEKIKEAAGMSTNFYDLEEGEVRALYEWRALEIINSTP